VQNYTARAAAQRLAKAMAAKSSEDDDDFDDADDDDDAFDVNDGAYGDKLSIPPRGAPPHPQVCVFLLPLVLCLKSGVFLAREVP
jgi:hypothetical protein